MSDEVLTDRIELVDPAASQKGKTPYERSIVVDAKPDLRAFYCELLTANRGSVTTTARHLKICNRTLYSILRRLELVPSDFRPKSHEIKDTYFLPK